MIRVQRDGKSLVVDASVHADLDSLLRACATDEGGEPRVIVALRVDGEPVSPDEAGSLDRFDPAAVREITMETRDTRQVALESLEGSASYAQRVAEALQPIADLLRSGRVEEANRIFADVLDAFAVLTFAVSSAARLLCGEGGALRSLESEVRPWLEAVARAQHERDWVRVADYLEYELRPRILEWPERIRAERDQIAGIETRAGLVRATEA